MKIRGVNQAEIWLGGSDVDNKAVDWGSLGSQGLPGLSSMREKYLSCCCCWVTHLGISSLDGDSLGDCLLAVRRKVITMASLFTARRKPKRINRDESSAEGQDNDRKSHSAPSSSLLLRLSNAPRQPCEAAAHHPKPIANIRPPSETDQTGPVVRRPQSKLRVSFNPSTTQDDTDSPSSHNDEDEPTRINRPAKPSRLGSSALSQSLQSRRLDQASDIRPNYNKSYLDELRNSTPSTPQPLSADHSGAEDETPPSTTHRPSNTTLDIASKFGPQPTPSSSIPNPSQIAEAKARRARLALEQRANPQATSTSTSSSLIPTSAQPAEDYISLDAYTSDGEFKPQRLQTSVYAHGPHHHATEKEHTRLIREDDDLAEGFDAFTEDAHSNRILMSRASKARSEAVEREKLRRRIARAEIGNDEDESENSPDDSESDSDAEARHAYEAAQTRSGLSARIDQDAKRVKRRSERGAKRPRQPERTVEVPTLGEGLARLRELQALATQRAETARRRKEEVLRRKGACEAEMERIQGALRELGEALEKVGREEKEITTGAADTNGTADHSDTAPLHDPQNSHVGRGLDSIGQP